MGYSAHIRFTAPVDPRAVWEAIRAVVEAPDNYAWTRYAPGSQMGPDGCWFAEPGQGANSLACMYYGPEGWSADQNSPDAGMIVKTGPHGTIVLDRLIYAEGRLDNGDSIIPANRPGGAA